MKFKKGFTLIEIVVVIGIIGVLTVIILPSLSNVRTRNRDTERISDIGTLQLSLLNYYSKYGYYPDSLNVGDSKLAPFITENLLVDPDGKLYEYVPLRRSTGTKCTYYHLGTTLESQTGQVDKTDNFDSRDSGSADMNNYVYCGTYGGPGIGTSTLNYNVHP